MDRDIEMEQEATSAYRPRFQYHVFLQFLNNRIKTTQIHQVLYKLRALNKLTKLEFEPHIDTTKIYITNLFKLVLSYVRIYLRRVYISVGVGARRVDQLYYANYNFFPNVEEIKLIFINDDFEEICTVKTLNMYQPLFLTNLHIESSYGIDRIIVGGNQDVFVTNCFFDGVGLCIFRGRNTNVQNSQFRNQRSYGLQCTECESVRLNHTYFYNCGTVGCYVVKCRYEAVLTGIQIMQCSLAGFDLQDTNNLYVKNVSTSSGGYGLNIKNCKGILDNVLVYRASQSGIPIENSKIFHNEVQCFQNRNENNVDVDEDSEFRQLSLNGQRQIWLFLFVNGVRQLPFLYRYL